MGGFAGEVGISASVGSGSVLQPEQQVVLSQFGLAVDTPQNLSDTLPVDTLVYVKSTTSFWQQTANGWIDTEADINSNQSLAQLTSDVAQIKNSLISLFNPLVI